MKILLSYGKHAQEVIPELIALADYFEKEEKNFPKELKLLKAQIVRQTIRQIEASSDAPVLRSIDSDPSE
jgi:sirohydrochlorin ferrochelatase